MNDKEIRASMTSEQIQLERKLTCEAIDGAMAFGYQNTNPPPSAEHWLTQFWNFGRKQAELEEALKGAAVIADSAGAEIKALRERIAASASAEPVAKITGADEYGPILKWTTHWADFVGSSLYAAPRPIEAPAQAVDEGGKAV